jgi:monoamine oxidase
VPLRGLSGTDHDIIVIGAGAAGLAAAAALTRAGRAVLTVEARDRIGGRCDTRRMPGVSVPVELGAEFIHGRPEATLSLLHEAGIAAVDTTRTQRVRFGRKLRAVDVFAEARKAMRRKPTTDSSFQRFLSNQKLSTLTRALAAMMVQGFDAADPRDASAQAIVEEWGSALTASHMRPQGGYLPLLRTLNVPVQLETVVREVRWSRGTVAVSGAHRGKPWSASAARALITLPLGVLQSGAVRFTPELEKRLDKLASGPVIRVAMAFKNAFWEKDHPGVAFFHDPKAPFPTFWTPLPMHAPLLTAWAGGPKAARLSGKREHELLHNALASVRSVLGRKEDPVAWLVQDWEADPYARGGYSYVKVGGAGAREMLQRSLDDTLYFAGEATDAQEAGTVGGALASGQRAAREILAAVG